MDFVTCAIRQSGRLGILKQIESIICAGHPVITSNSFGDKYKISSKLRKIKKS